MPYNGHADESEHIIRAYAVVDGQVLAKPAVLPDGHPGAYFDVPRSIAPPNRFCMYFKYSEDYQRTIGTHLNASCLQQTTDRTMVNTWSWVGRYNPAYYVLAGVPIYLSPSMYGIVGARLLTAVAFAFLMAVAVRAAWLTQRPLMVLGVIVAGTPSIVGLSGAVNPGGLEVAAGIALWPLLYLLWTQHDALTSRSYHRLLWLAAGVACLLATLRGLGVLLLVLGAVAVALIVGPQRVFHRLRTDAAWRWPLTAIGSAMALATAWNLISGNFRWHKWIGASNLSHAEALKAEIGYRLDDWLYQTVAQFGWADTFLPFWVVITWFVVLALMIGPVMLTADRRQALLLICVPVTALGILVGLEHKYLHTLGMFAQYSRYVMPFAVVLPVMAAALSYPGGERAVSRLVTVVMPCLIGCQAIALPIVMTRFQYGPDLRFGPLRGDWMPTSGPWLPLLLMAAGAGMLGLVGYQIRQRGDRPRPTIAAQTSSRALSRLSSMLPR
jgi:hypothetical protein